MLRLERVGELRGSSGTAVLAFLSDVQAWRSTPVVLLCLPAPRRVVFLCRSRGCLFHVITPVVLLCLPAPRTSNRLRARLR